LAALITFAVVTGDNPRGLPTVLTCPAVEKEQPVDKKVELRIAPDVARQLQDAAAASLESPRNSAEVPPIVRPALPKGEVVKASDLAR
jgi:hypothetical protein